MEFPNYKSVPEVILNGWLDVLVHIRNYAKYTQDGSALDLYNKNLYFLIKTLPYYDAAQLNLSRYSDVTPYRFQIYHPSIGNNSKQQLLKVVVIHVPRLKELKPFAYDISIDNIVQKNNKKQVSIYDNHFINVEKGKASLWISSSRFYENKIIVNLPNANISLLIGSYHAHSSTPRVNSSKSVNIAGQTIKNKITLFPLDHKLLDETCGYPTNFLKQGKYNFYHVYHVVTLLALGLDEKDPVVKKELLKWGLKWNDYIAKNNYQKFGNFSPPDQVWEILKRWHKNELYDKTFSQLVVESTKALQ